MTPWTRDPGPADLGLGAWDLVLGPLSSGLRTMDLEPGTWYDTRDVKLGTIDSESGPRGLGSLGSGSGTLDLEPGTRYGTWDVELGAIELGTWNLGPGT